MESSSIRIVTFNLRCVWQGHDGINDFIYRAGMVYDKIMHELPDVILFQEMIALHLALLRRMLPEYTFCGHFRDSDYTGEGVFNLGTGHGYSVLDMVHAFEKANGVKVPYEITARRPGDLATCYADPAKSLEVLGWKAEKNLVDMCRDTWNWQKQNPNGYEQ